MTIDDGDVDMPYQRIRELRAAGDIVDAEQLRLASEWERSMKAARERRLLAAVVAIWTHTEEHTTYVPGQGYRWQTGQPPCPDVRLHERLAAEEGEAWHSYRRSLR